jgi:hypothetical protein
VMSSVLRLVNALVAGRLPRLPYLLDSRLIAVRTCCGGIRPIAIQEVWLRLAGMCVLEACGTNGLAPLHLGIGVSGGSEAIGNALRAALCSDPANAVVRVDFANAFNTLLRSCSQDSSSQPSPRNAVFHTMVVRGTLQLAS